ncbi:DUF1588 domain-containing protein [Bdellovibrio sp. HCB337]|uniref:DUF1588 domain-containing protein n=1 Tax=Bdellovibrio sp. HCB337 TaxID=3394358 RepID=UPI0039A68CCD
MQRALVAFVAIVILGVLPLAFQNCGRGFVSETSGEMNLGSSAGNQPDYVPENNDVVQGKALYQTNCSGCHGDYQNTALVGKTALDIRNATTRVSQMFAFQALSDREVELIAIALNMGNDRSPGASPTPTQAPTPTPTATPAPTPTPSPGSTPAPTPTATLTPTPTVTPTPTPGPAANFFPCEPGSDPGIRDLRRLSRREYLQTLKMLTQNRVNLADLQAQIDLLPPDIVSEVFDSTDPSMSASHIAAYMAIAKALAPRLSTNAQWLQGVLNCTYTQGMTDTCWNNFFNGFATQVYRRPLTAAEKTTYKEIYSSEFGGSVSAGLEVVTMTMLQSPHFIYKVELAGSPIPNRTDLLTLNEYELASRIAFLATGRGPDFTLLTEVATGKLKTDAGYQTVVNRIFGTAESREHIREFYAQWLGTNRMPAPAHSAWFLGNIPRDQIVPEATQEIVDFTNYFTYQTQGTYKDLLTSPVNFIKGQALTSIYGATSTSTLSDVERSGVMSRTGFMLSPTNNNSLVHRGLAVRRNILCDSISLPVIAENEKELFTAPTPDPKMSQRQQIETRTSPIRCQACHALINPMGFVMENYNSFGKYRTVESIFDANGNVLATHQVNARVKPNIESTNEPEVNGLKEMAHAIANSSKGPACMVKQWATYNQGRATTIADSCSLNTSYTQLTNPDKVSASGDKPGTLLNMIKSPAFDPHFRLRKRGTQ